MDWLRKLIKDLFEYLTSFRNITYFDLLDEYEDYVRGEDVSVRDTLVGALRNREQYEVNLNNNFYHIPKSQLECDDVRYVALYRSKSLFGSDSPGVIHYGRVKACSLVKRYEIKELAMSFSHDEDYYRFDVDEWQELKNHVLPRETGPHAMLLTNHYLLENARFVNELLIENNEEFKLHLALLDITSGVYDGFFVGDVKVRASHSRIVVITPKGKNYVSIKEYKRTPLATLKKLYSVIFPS